MDFPVWYVPGMSKGLIMALTSIIHVFVAQFAVGGGIYLVWMERRAQSMNSRPILTWLHRHTFFFLLLTMVFGGLTGVGIWFTMSVANPAATSTLIHTFLWIWASEWVFFLVEIVALLVYYYSYSLMLQGRFSRRTHLRIGYVYAVSAWLSLVLINGVICFMLTPGKALESASIVDAFFNPSMLPSLVFRTSLCLVLAGMFALFTAARIQEEDAKQKVIRLSSLWICLPFLALLASTWWYFSVLPPARQAAVLRRTADMHPYLLAYGWVLPIIFLLGVVAFVLAARFRRPLAVLILGTGLVLVGSFEWLREGGRRPWVIPGYMYSSTVLPRDGAFINRHGVDSVSPWLRMYDAEHRDDANPLTGRGAIIFAQQCGTCHGAGGPSLDILPRLKGLTLDGLYAQIGGQGTAIVYMPPFFGTDEDRADLATYLNAIREKAEE